MTRQMHSPLNFASSLRGFSILQAALGFLTVDKTYITKLGMKSEKKKPQKKTYNELSPHLSFLFFPESIFNILSSK